MLDRKGIFSFLAITFGLTYALEIPLALSGFRLVGMASAAGNYLFLPIMFMPALSAIITAKFITKEGFGQMGLRFGSWKQYLAIGLLIPALFVLVYAITWLLGIGQPDWNLDYFKSLFAVTNMEIPPMPDVRLIWLGLSLSTLTVGTLFNWLFCFGEELGWRGYLLPKLMPLGKPKAYLLMGIIWSAWHWPLVLIGFAYNQEMSILALLAFTALTTGLGIYLNELTLRYKSSILAGWAHGVFNTEKLGIWYLLFPSAQPYMLSPFLGGYTGIIGLLVWFALGFWEIRQAKTTAHLIQVPSPVALH